MPPLSGEILLLRIRDREEKESVKRSSLGFKFLEVDYPLLKFNSRS